MHMYMFSSFDFFFLSTAGGHYSRARVELDASVHRIIISSVAIAIAILELGEGKGRRETFKFFDIRFFNCRHNQI